MRVRVRACAGNARSLVHLERAAAAPTLRQVIIFLLGACIATADRAVWRGCAGPSQTNVPLSLGVSCGCNDCKKLPARERTRLLGYAVKVGCKGGSKTEERCRWLKWACRRLNRAEYKHAKFKTRTRNSVHVVVNRLEKCGALRSFYMH